MGTPSAQDEPKTVRLTAEVHRRLQRLAGGLNGTSMNNAIDWLLSPGMIRLDLTPEQRERWKRAADDVGMRVGDFAIARVEAAMQYGADPGTLRRMHDMLAALVRAADIIPQQSTPNAERQVITDHRPH